MPTSKVPDVPRLMPPEVRANCLRIRGELHHGWMECENCGAWRLEQRRTGAHDAKA